MNRKIAVFTKNHQHFRNFKCYPKNMFVRIKSIEDIRGRLFSGVIEYADWYEGSIELPNAYRALQIRQPELFTKN